MEAGNMIYCSINDFGKLPKIGNIDKAVERIKSINTENYAAGQIVIDGKDVFLNLFEYDTKDAALSTSEAHRKYIDVMYVVEGEETVLVKNLADESCITKEYDKADDYLLAKTDADASAIRLYPGMLLILFPEDAHAPGCNTDSTHHVKKIVGKVKIN